MNAAVSPFSSYRASVSLRRKLILSQYNIVTLGRRSVSILLISEITHSLKAGVAQLVEQLIRNQGVGGSIPLSGTIKSKSYTTFVTSLQMVCNDFVTKTRSAACFRWSLLKCA